MLIQNRNYIADSIDKIKKLYPEVQSVYFKNTPDKNGSYHCHVELRCFGKKLFVMKQGYSYVEAILKAEQTMLKVLKKEKDKILQSRHEPKPMLWRTDHVTALTA